MIKYDIMFEALQERVNSGVLTVEEAEILNDLAFEKYGEDETEYELVEEATRLAKEIDKAMLKEKEKIEGLNKTIEQLAEKLKNTESKFVQDELKREIAKCRVRIMTHTNRLKYYQDRNSINIGKRKDESSEYSHFLLSDLNKKITDHRKEYDDISKENEKLMKSKNIFRKKDNAEKIASNKIKLSKIQDDIDTLSDDMFSHISNIDIVQRQFRDAEGKRKKDLQRSKDTGILK